MSRQSKKDISRKFSALQAYRDLLKALLTETPDILLADCSISRGADVNMVCEQYEYKPLLHLLAEKGYVDSVQFLLKQSTINIDVVDENCVNALQHAIQHDAPRLRDVAMVLVGSNIELAHKDDEGRNAINYLDRIILKRGHQSRHPANTFIWLKELCEPQGYINKIAEIATTIKNVQIRKFSAVKR